MVTFNLHKRLLSTYHGDGNVLHIPRTLHVTKAAKFGRGLIYERKKTLESLKYLLLRNSGIRCLMSLQTHRGQSSGSESRMEWLEGSRVRGEDLLIISRHSEMELLGPLSVSGSVEK